MITTTIFFADDTSVFMEHNNLDQMQTLIAITIS